jgi:hypothetical protein
MNDVPPFTETQAKEQLLWDYRQQYPPLSFTVEEHGDDHRRDGTVYLHIGEQRRVDTYFYVEDSDG